MLTIKFPSLTEEPPSHLGPLDPGSLCHWPPPRSLYALIRRISAPALPSLDPSPLLPHTRTSSHHLSFSILLNGYNPSVRTAHWSENRSTPTPPTADEAREKAGSWERSYTRSSRLKREALTQTSCCSPWLERRQRSWKGITLSAR